MSAHTDDREALREWGSGRGHRPALGRGGIRSRAWLVAVGLVVTVLLAGCGSQSIARRRDMRACSLLSHQLEGLTATILDLQGGAGPGMTASGLTAIAASVLQEAHIAGADERPSFAN